MRRAGVKLKTPHKAVRPRTKMPHEGISIVRGLSYYTPFRYYHQEEAHSFLPR